MRFLLASFALNFSFALLSAQSATAQKFAITDLGTLPTGTTSAGYAINELGQVTGYSNSINFSSPQHAFLYSEGNMTDLGTLPGGTRSAGLGINEGGRRKERGREDKRREQGGENIQVTGYSNTADGTNHAFLYSNGSMLDLGTLPSFGTGYVYSGGMAINKSGQVTGYSGANEAGEHAFFYNNGTMLDLGTLPRGDTSGGLGINESGEVTGMSSTYNAQNVYGVHAFLYSNGKMSDLGTLPGGIVSIGIGINDSGEVTGSSDGAEITPGNVHAFLYRHGRMLDLGTLPGQTSSVGRGINRLGQVVGSSSTLGDNTNSRAFLYSDGDMKDLNGLIRRHSGWSLLAAYAINDRGQITGYGSINGVTRAFLLTPACSDEHEHGWRGGEHDRDDQKCD